MADDLLAIMSRDRLRRTMLNDPDLTGDALLFALALHEVLVARHEQGRRSLKRWVDEVEALAWPPNSRQPGARARAVVADDVPRYEPARHGHATPCIAPMIRREGLCGKHATIIMVDRDPESGAACWVGLCSRHKDVRAQFDARAKAWVDNGRPTPAPNAGGVLGRYFDADWGKVYQWAAPWRKPLDGAREATPPRPCLRLIRGGSALPNSGRDGSV